VSVCFGDSERDGEIDLRCFSGRNRMFDGEIVDEKFGEIFIGVLPVQGQSATINSTLADIKSFQTASVTTTSRAFNALFTEVYGHFFRSQNTLRLARQSVFTASSRFPVHTLTEDTRKNLVTLLSSLFTKSMDPTIDFLQKESMLRFYNYDKDESTPIERTFKAIAPQLEELSDAVSNTTNDACLRRENINRRLPNEYSAIISAINDCTRNASAVYRAPINEFTRLHFDALPLITRIGAGKSYKYSDILRRFTNKNSTDLLACANNGANRESCVVRFLKTYCDDTANETCKTGSTM
jgi:hypothetical protein